MIQLLSSSLISLPAVRLDGGRCYIRPPMPRDWREWATVRGQSHAFLKPWEPTWPADALTRPMFGRRLRRQAKEWRDDEGYSFLIFRAGDDQLIGGLALTNIRRGVAQTATLGYWIGQSFARQGYMSEAVGLALRFAFIQLSLHRVEAACLPTNLASRGVLKKTGFSEEGYARGYLRIDGLWQDHVLHAILKDDWRG